MNAQKTLLLHQKQASGKSEPTTGRRISATPKMRLHKATGQAYAVLNGKYIFFGRYGMPEATQKYHQTIAEWIAAGKQAVLPPTEVSINEIIAQFWTHAQQYYVHADGSATNELKNFRLALRPLVTLYGNSRAVEFGPRALVAVRQTLITNGLCRNNINKMVGRIKLLFRWAAEKELIPGSVYHALHSVRGLPKGRSEARESDPVRPVPQEHVDAIKPYVSRQIWTMIQLQLLTAARPGEIIKMRPCDIDRSGKIWVYCPQDHKTAHHGHQRKIYIGPKGQEMLQPFLLRPADAYCFSPAEADAQRRIKQHENRKTRLSCGNVPGSNCKEDPMWVSGNVYTVDSYRKAIMRAIEKAFPAPEHLVKLPDETHEQWQKRLSKKGKAELKAWYKQYHWHPHQLRHNAATFLRKEFGLETARIILGHRSAVITEVYAEQDQQKALEVIMRVG